MNGFSCKFCAYKTEVIPDEASISAMIVTYTEQNM